MRNKFIMCKFTSPLSYKHFYPKISKEKVIFLNEKKGGLLFGKHSQGFTSQTKTTMHGKVLKIKIKVYQRCLNLKRNIPSI